MRITQELRRKANKGELQRLRDQAGFNEGRKFDTGPANSLDKNTRKEIADRIGAAIEPEKFRQATRIMEDLSDYRKGRYGTAEKKRDELKV